MEYFFMLWSQYFVKREIHFMSHCTYVYLREVYGFKLPRKCAWMMNVYTLLLVLKSSTNQLSQHVHFAKLYKIALIVKSSDHNIALTHQEVLPCEKHSLNFKHGKKRSKCKIQLRLESISNDIQLTNSNKHQAKKRCTHTCTRTHTDTFTHIYMYI